MEAFAARLVDRGYDGLLLRTTIIPDKDHQTSARPGFAWAIREALPPSVVANP